MSQPFLPPSPDKRCQAIVQRDGWSWWSGQRCQQRHLAGTDLCRRHAEQERAGQRVRRVRAAQRVESHS